jgi:hypothetical protein
MVLEVLSILKNIMLAQAHECILKKAVLDNPKSAIASRISAQIADHYDLALTRLSVLFGDAKNKGAPACCCLPPLRLPQMFLCKKKRLWIDRLLSLD